MWMGVSCAVSVLTVLQVSGQVPVNESSVLLTFNCTDLPHNGGAGLSLVKDIQVFITETADVPKVLLLQGDKKVVENEVNQEVGTFVVINELTQSVIAAVVGAFV